MYCYNYFIKMAYRQNQCNNLMDSKMRLVREIWENRINYQNAINQYPLTVFSPAALQQLEAKIAAFKKILDNDFKQVVALDEQISSVCGFVDPSGGYFSSTPPFNSIIFSSAGGVGNRIKGWIYNQQGRRAGYLEGDYDGRNLTGVWSILNEPGGRLNITFTNPRFFRGFYGYGDKEFTYELTGFKNWDYRVFPEQTNFDY